LIEKQQSAAGEVPRDATQNSRFAISDNESEHMERTISLPDDLLAQIEGTAAQQGKSLDQVIEESLRAQMEDRSWLDLLEYGRQTGHESGYTEADVPGIVKARRRINAGRS
jgi:hypothetical protein